MPAILPRPAQRSLYPDTSTLAYAFAGLTLDAPPEQREVTTLIQDVARQANLCLSFAHLIEFVLNTEQDERLARAHWLDTLDVVWMRDVQEVIDLELEQFLRRAAGGSERISLGVCISRGRQKRRLGARTERKRQHQFLHEQKS